MTTIQEPGLLTDLYELTMAQAYFRQERFAPATFSLFIRNYPPNRSYFVAAGLADVLSYLEGWHFPQESIDYLHSTGIFSGDFLDYLLGLKFTGDVWAIPEGRLFFTDEPVIEVTGPIIEAQIVETYIINQMNLQTLLATKAARCAWAAGGRSLVDFSFRRTQGIDAGLKMARSSYIAGFGATSNVLAGKVYGIPVSGTMAHSLITSYEDEIDAFRAFVQTFPDRSILLIDTYDTISGARKAALVGKEMEAVGQRLQGVRLDSGDFAALSKEVRGILDEAGLEYVNIIASGGLDEFEIEGLVGCGAPIDGFGVGTRMGVSADAPWSDMAYKLVEYDGRPVLKLSAGKVSLPGEKQVFRSLDGDGKFSHDTLALRHEDPEDGVPILQKVMEGGRATGQPPTLGEIRERFRQDFNRLDDRLKALRDPPQYQVKLSPQLEELARRIEQERLAEQVGRDPVETQGYDGREGV